MKRTLAALLAVLSLAESASARSLPMPEDVQFAFAFFGRPAHSLSTTFAAPLARGQADVLQQILMMMREEPAEILQPVFAANGFHMEMGDLRGAIEDARALKTVSDVRASEASRLAAIARAEEERRLAEQRQREEAERQAKRAAEQAVAEARRLAEARIEEQHRYFDGAPSRSKLSFIAVGGAGSAAGKGTVASYGVMARYGVPIAEGKLGNIGPELGFIHTLRRANKDQDLGSRQVFLSSDGQYRVTEWTRRKIHDKIDLFSILGLSYQTPPVTNSGKAFLNFEFGSRGGVGRMDDRRVERVGEQEHLKTFGRWETVTDKELRRTETGGTTERLFYTAYAAANVALAEHLSLRLEFERYFLSAFRTGDAKVGRAGIRARF